MFSQTGTEAIIYTPACNEVGNSKYFTEYDERTIDSINDYFMNAYPNAEFIGNSSATYNCHGYAWYVTEGGEDVWIGADRGSPEELFMTDGSYLRIPSESEGEWAGQKVSYRFNTGPTGHSAVTSSTSGWLISKWAYGPLMKHTPNDCPYASSYNHLEYWTSIMTLDGTIQTGTYTAYGELTSSGQTAPSSNVHFESGRSIILKPGFHAQNSTFHATIIPACWPDSDSGLKSAEVNEISNAPSDYDSDNEDENNLYSKNFEPFIYPNPVSNILYIDGVSNFNVKIVDCFGKQVLYRDNSNGIVNMSDLESGMYYIEISGQEMNYTEKIIKE